MPNPRPSDHTADPNDAIVVALGANKPSAIGPPLETLRAALAALEGGGVRVAAVAPWIGTPAWPPGNGADYVNGAARLETALPAADLLARLLSVETAMGRVRGVRWGARVCDIDLLCHGQTVLPGPAAWARLAALPPEQSAAEQPGLVIPHPRMADRVFALLPFCAVAPEWRHPVNGYTVRGMLDALPRDMIEGVTYL